MATQSKAVTIKDKVLLEKIIDKYLMNDIPLSLLLEQYDLTYPQMQLLMNRVRGFSRQSEALDEANEVFSYDDLPEEYLVIPHTFTEEYPYTQDEMQARFKRLEELKELLANTPEVNLEEYKQRVATAKAKLETYDQVTIGNIEAFMRDYDEYVAQGTEIDEMLLIRLLSKNHIPLRESNNLNNLYSNYLTDKEELLKAEKELEIKRLERKERFKLEREYEQIREELITHNVKLVNWCIRRFFNNIAISKEEAQAYGLEGLVMSINKFDYKKGFYFSTFAVRVIVQNIERHFKELYGMKWNEFINKNAIKYYRRLMRAADPTRLTDITPQELADLGLMSLSAEQIANYDELAYPAQPFSSVYEDLDDGYEHTRKSEMPATMEEYETIDEYQEQTEILDIDSEIEDLVLDKQVKGALEEVIKTLTEREAEVLRLRFGFEDGILHGYTEIARMYGLSKERIRQIESKAIRKLRHPSRAVKIRDFYGDTHGTYYGEPEPNITIDEVYEKLRYLLSLDIGKNGMLAFMNMEGLNWTEEDLEDAISTLMLVTDMVINYALDGKTISGMQHFIYLETGISFSCRFIEDIVERVKEKLTPEIVENLLPKSKRSSKKL